MLNRLLADIGNELAKMPFERVFWWWGPKWLDFISVDSPLTFDNPLWQRDKKSLRKARLFGLSPDELQAEIIHYWQQPFWKRWILALFTSIYSKIKLWSYYHRCLALREVCIEDLYAIHEPIALVFEQHLGKEMVKKLYRSTIKFDKYLEKRAGNLRIKDKVGSWQNTFLVKNSRFFSKLMNKKLSQLSTEVDKVSLSSQLKKEFGRLESMLFQYLFIWHEGIYPTKDEALISDLFTEVISGKEISFSILSIHDWVKLKQEIITSMLESSSPEQFLNIKNLLKSCLVRLSSLVDIHLNNCVKLIKQVKRRKLSCKQAIKEVKIRQAELIYFFKKGALLFHPDKSFANEEVIKIKTELFPEFQQLSVQTQQSINGKLQELRRYLPIRRPKIQKMNGQVMALEAGVKINSDSTQLEREEAKISMDKYIQSQARSNLIHHPFNDFIQEENEPPERRPRFRKLARCTMYPK